jgi:glyoxylase-like metal-dependent hydrolase (beta-lactamase superfamily II)/rhodanese-related sulfurtransferase
MFLRQYYLGCLSQASYLIGDTGTGRAVVVDPRRDIDEYLDDAAREGLAIELVIETHFHADFVSGHLELAHATGATVAYGEGADPSFDWRPLRDGERISLGDVVLEIRATPGHTPESISIVVYEHDGDDEPYGVLTGDTLFIGDVGRPDLLASVGVTAEALAAQLYDSLRTKLLTLPDETRVFPGHGAGSACGKSLSTETVSTIGTERVTNYALAPMSVDEFVDVVTEGQSTAPAYFAFDAAQNRQTRELLDETEEVRRLTIEELLELQETGAVILDTRDATDFAAGHLVGAVNVGLNGRFAEYVGSVVAPSSSVALVSDPGTEREARNRLARVGFDHVRGALADPVETFLRRPDVVVQSSRLTASELRDTLAADPSVQVVDVRAPSEVADGAMSAARHMPLTELASRVDELDPSRPVLVYCAGGYRSMIASSLLAAREFTDVSDLLGGYGAWANLAERDR